MVKCYSIRSSERCLAVHEKKYFKGWFLPSYLQHTLIKNYLQLQQTFFGVNALEKAYIHGTKNLFQLKDCLKLKTFASNHYKNLFLSFGAVLAFLFSGNIFANIHLYKLQYHDKRFSRFFGKRNKSYVFQNQEKKFKSNTTNRLVKPFRFSTKDGIGLKLVLNSKMSLTLGIKNLKVWVPKMLLKSPRKTKGLFLRFQHAF